MSATEPNAAPANGPQDDEAPKIQEVRVVNGPPTGWGAMATDVRDYDEDKVKSCKEDIDTLLVFVSHFLSLSLMIYT